MKVLLIGNGNSIWIKNYIRDVLISNNAKIYLYTNIITNDKYLNYYKENNINIINIKNKYTLIKKIPKVRGVINIIFVLYEIWKNRNYDVIHVHFADSLSCWLALICRGMTKKEVCSFWGSDLMRVSDKKLRKLTRYLNQCHVITITTKKMINKFISIYGHRYDYKIKRNRFGIETYDIIDNIITSEDQNSIREKLRIPDSKIIICIGYNGSEAQQHLKVIEQISRIDPILCKNIFIILQMTYGCSSEVYYNKIKKSLESLACKSMILTDYMDDYDIARLRCATDIFIHAQTTDGLSASFQEYIYAGAIVVNAIWLNYEELEELGIRYIKYSSFDEIPSLLVNLINNMHYYKSINIENRNILKSYTSIKAVSKQWYSLYLN